MLATRLPDDDCQPIDTSALPVKHTSRVRGAGGWTGRVMTCRPVRPRRRVRGMVLRLPAGHQD